MGEGSSWRVDVFTKQGEGTSAHVELRAVPELSVGIVRSDDLVSISGKTEDTTIVGCGLPGLRNCEAEWIGKAGVVAVVTHAWNHSGRFVR